MFTVAGLVDLEETSQEDLVGPGVVFVETDLDVIEETAAVKESVWVETPTSVGIGGGGNLRSYSCFII